MKSVSRRFFGKGIYNQKRADIIFELKRIDLAEVDRWSDEKKASAIKFLGYIKSDLALFSRVLNGALKPKGTNGQRIGNKLKK